jgi:mono/diheme cytochrome c family protein
MSRNLLLSAITILCLLFLLLPTFTHGKPPQAAAASPDQVKRGQYLVTFGGCNDCHTPKKMGPKGPEPDMTRMLSGHPAEEKLPEIPAGVLGPDKWGILATGDGTAWAGPWGVSFTMNLTPDQETGLGSWTEAMFIKAMRTGKHMGEGRDILPPMPWPSLQALTDDDLKAIFAYLHTIPPVKNAVPDPIPPAGK